MENITGVVKKISWQDADSFRKYFFVQPDGTGRWVKCQGIAVNVYEGASVEVSGEWEEGKDGQLYINIAQCVTKTPSDDEGIIEFLSCGLVNGIRRTIAERIAAHFHSDTFRILDEEPKRLLEVHGIGPIRHRQVMESWREHREYADAIAFLSTLDVPVSKALDIIKVFKKDTVQAVKKDPYMLIDFVEGFEFPASDRIAKSLGIAPDAPNRLKAAVRYAMRQGTVRGHVFLTENEFKGFLLNRNITDMTRALLHTALEYASADGKIVIEDGRYYLDYMYRAECGSVERLNALLAAEIDERGIYDISAIRDRTDVEYDESQRNAIEYAMVSHVLVITGGPGTGKTTTIRGIIEAFALSGKSAVLAAPTGRAAKRMSEATSHKASTIHKLLEYNGSDFQRNRHNPLDCSVLIMDECSMIDIRLFYAVLDALPSSSVLILVGDANQLPSVGPGTVFGDLIMSGAVPVVELQYVHRQGRESLIAENAQRIKGGNLPKYGWDMKQDYYFEPASFDQEIRDKIVYFVMEASREKYGIDPLDVQVLSPQKKGILGTRALNVLLQSVLNPPAPWKNEIEYKERIDGQDVFLIFREGDRVMNVRNDYDRKIMNGDVGKITEVDPADGLVAVEFIDEMGNAHSCEFRKRDFHSLLLAYAVTVHKAQGSEYPMAVFPVTGSHWHVTRRLYYTALTRAKKCFITIGMERALVRDVNDVSESRRNSYFLERLRGE